METHVSNMIHIDYTEMDAHNRRLLKSEAVQS